jgi:hypothetical protein
VALVAPLPSPLKGLQAFLSLDLINYSALSD